MPTSPQAPAPATCRLGTVAQLADALHVHKGTCWRWLALAEAGHKPGFPRPIRLGDKAVRVKWADVQAYLDALAAGTVRQ